MIMEWLKSQQASPRVIEDIIIRKNSKPLMQMINFNQNLEDPLVSVKKMYMKNRSAQQSPDRPTAEMIKDAEQERKTYSLSQQLLKILHLTDKMKNRDAN